ncbi:MAG TPA: hypothetical protein VK663_00900 [Burkholderiales bacterium]|nr:hypothetical protein [Burkholderiales bacterium]
MATTISSMEIAEDHAATNSSTKKAAAAAVPNGILANDSGNETNTSPGPLAGSMPLANTIGNITRPANSEITVLARTDTIATCLRSIAGLL